MPSHTPISKPIFSPIHRPTHVPGALSGGVPWQSLRLTSPASGSLLSEWWFAESAGSVVADQVGANSIDLSLPTTPNYTWTSTGIQTSSGLVQSPVVNGCMTFAALIKVPKDNSSGFTISGGTATNSGIIGSTGYAGSLVHTASGRGVIPLFGRVGTSAGTGTTVSSAAYRLNRGGWFLLFIELPSTYNSAWGFGGQIGTTTNRVATFDVAWSAVFSGVLTDTEKTQVYTMARALAKERGFYIDYRDCPSQVDTVCVWGQSNAEGKGRISNLSVAYQDRTSPAGCKISNRNNLTTAPLVMGVNQQLDSPATDFGPEMGLAWKSEDNGRGLYISKFGAGNTFLALTGSTDWNVAENAGISHFNGALRNFWTLEADMLNDGVGPHLRGLAWMQGENDATNVLYGAEYQSNLVDLISTFRQQVGDSQAKVALARIVATDPLSDPTALTDVRSAVATISSSDANVDWFSTDGWQMRDTVHYDGSGQKLLGEAFYDSLIGT